MLWFSFKNVSPTFGGGVFCEDSRPPFEIYCFRFYVIDAKDDFKKTVVQYFLDGYARGETPNPCLI
ncbi:MAG: hypothetical protein IPN96_17715 [Anaerolineales bacterium]|nr:hypothetical protein [Anaerolineales bacterium]